MAYVISRKEYNLRWEKDGLTRYTPVKPYFQYSISETATQYTLTIDAGLYFRDSVGGKYSCSDTIRIDGTGQTSKNGTISHTLMSSGYAAVINSFTWTYNKGAEAAVKTITAYSPSHATEADLKATMNFTVPALTAYTVDYDANGGTGVPTSQTKYAGIALTLSSAKPTFDGYTFRGWATSKVRADSKNSDQTPKYIDYASGSSYTTNESVTLYAAWEKDYIAPLLTSCKVERCKSNGALDDEGTYASVSFNWSIDKTKHTSNAVDALTVAVGSKTVQVQTSSSASSGTETVVVGDGTFSTDSTYSVTITLADTCVEATTVSWTGMLSYAAFPIDISANGSSVGILMPAPDDTHGVYIGDDIYVKRGGNIKQLFDIFYPVGSYYETSDSSFDPSTSLGGTWSSEEIVDDEIVEQGTNSIWTYRKWKSGIAECWGRRDITISLNNNYGGAYYSTDAVGFPTDLFSAEPTVSISRQGRQGTGLVHISPYSVSSTQIQYFITNTNGRYDSAPIGIAINARGLWKTYSAPSKKYRWHRTA